MPPTDLQLKRKEARQTAAASIHPGLCATIANTADSSMHVVMLEWQNLLDLFHWVYRLNLKNLSVYVHLKVEVHAKPAFCHILNLIYLTM